MDLLDVAQMYEERSMTSDSDRLDALEEICAHQASEIESLSELVNQQWTRIEELTTALSRFRDRLAEVETGNPVENTKPPHY